MRSRSVALLVLSLSVPATAPADEYLLWHMIGGDWLYAGKPAQPLQAVGDVGKLVLSQGSGKALLLRNGTSTVKACDSPQRCTTVETKAAANDPGKNHWWDPLMAGWRSVNARPEFQLPMSRAAGWRDAVVIKQADGMIDLRDVFSAARARNMNFELCSIETHQCVKGLSADWDGTSARLKEQGGLALGTYRLIALNGNNEAWIRVVDPGEYPQVKKSYEEALAAIHTWSLPPEWEGAPSLDRLKRMALAGVGHGR